MTRQIQMLDLIDPAKSDSPILVHADLMQARVFAPMLASRPALLEAHLDALTRAASERPLWLACFNYDFTKNGEFSNADSPCQVGPLGDYVRKQPIAWRTDDPVFSVCGIGPAPESRQSSHVIAAFGEDSVFGQLYAGDGDLLFYGAAFSSATIIHFAESRSGGPVYRYDKDFVGTVVDKSGRKTSATYRYHVRPMGMSLEYDWPRLEADLLREGILVSQDNRGKSVAMTARVRTLVDYWTDRLYTDPLYLLDAATAQKVNGFSLARGERLQLSQFEAARAA